MGRLLRKKNPAKKKKRQNGESAIKQNGGAVKSAQSNQGKSDGSLFKSSPARRKTGTAPGGKKSVSPKLIEKTGISGVLDKSFQFLREVKAELKKVTWPPRKQTMGSTAVVIILVMIISFFLGMVDMGLSGLIRLVLQ